MFSQTQTACPARGTTYSQMLERVRYDGAYPTRERAERVVRAVLGALGRQLPVTEREALAACLPEEAGLILRDQVTVAEPLTGWGFVKDLAAEMGGTPATTRWDTGAVLAVVSNLAGDQLMAQVLDELPPGYALLFGRAELTQRAA
ncbi:DUF2267 domain-containing protein [Streptomyces sp. NPDC005438]|uniref:DUF2267 domain-containing protein n=1 Tax=Streptomyces sp. NPDC005438 TaxID=3156880 RepID=UPI0033BA9179